MSYEASIEVRTTDINALMTPELEQRIDVSRRAFADTSYAQLCDETNNARQIKPYENAANAVVLGPRSGYVDESQTLVLDLPHNNTWAPHHLVRARVLQDVVAPNSRVVIFPNNRLGIKNYTVDANNQDDGYLFERGSLRPIAEQKLRTLEALELYHPLGDLAMTGYSYGAKGVLAMGAIGQHLLPISAINADEAPSMLNRNTLGLMQDFAQSSGGVKGVEKAAREAEIPALVEALTGFHATKDAAKYLLSLTTKESRLLQQGMQFDVFDLVATINRRRQDMPVKLGHIANSTLFKLDDATGLDLLIRSVNNVSIVEYTGSEHLKHAAGDNPFKHALMAYDGLVNEPKRNQAPQATRE